MCGIIKFKKIYKDDRNVINTLPINCFDTEWPYIRKIKTYGAQEDSQKSSGDGKV